MKKIRIGILLFCVLINLNLVFCQDDIEIDTIRLEVFLDDYLRMHEGFLTRLAEIESIESYNSLIKSYYSVLLVWDSDYSSFSSVLNRDCCIKRFNKLYDIRLQNLTNDFCDKFGKLDFNAGYVFNQKPDQLTGNDLPKSTIKVIEKAYSKINHKISEDFRMFIYMTWDLKSKSDSSFNNDTY